MGSRHALKREKEERMTYGISICLNTEEIPQAVQR
jgi:hypothetical protein